ncbi:MAG: glycosyltransferase family 8 protein [Treponema sp.]|jgi:lipopolysaccharide biosynthesis glycosyltransferase|nr:glycosyltransferase family 8 protein [Treponema sp.]
MENKAFIPVVFSADDYFVPYMAALVQSIMDNAQRPSGYRFFVLHRGISAGNRQLLQSQVDGKTGAAGGGGPSFSVDFVDVSAHIKDYRFPTHFLPAESYFRLLIPYLFDYEKIIYLDSDMIVNTDLAELYAVDPGTNLLAACRDDFLAGDRGRGHARSIGLSGHQDYFNAGMLLINRERFVQSIAKERLLGLAVSQDWRFCDQDVLNVVCAEKTLILNMEWNAMVTMYNEDQFPLNLRQEYRRSRANPKITHFAGPKPWDRRFSFGFNSGPRKAQLELFLRYAERTPFIGVVKERMEREAKFPPIQEF